MSRHWTLDDIRWEDFDASKVDPELLQAVKAAALVEFNAPDYVTYLCNVFSDCPDVKEAIHQWGGEEVQHGQALARWAEMADPDFSFDDAFRRFRENYSIPLDAIESVRGSRGGELIARCVVESGTSSYYSAIRDATDEPVLKQIASNIAADEFRHYKLFYDQFNGLTEKVPSTLGRARVALGRQMTTNWPPPSTRPIRRSTVRCLTTARSIRKPMRSAPLHCTSASMSSGWFRWWPRPPVSSRMAG